MKKLIFLFSLQLLFIYTMAQYVTLYGNQFRLNGEKFYPMALNYGVNILKNGDNYFVSPDHTYNLTNAWECNDSVSCGTQMQIDFEYIAGMGFNSIRIFGSGPKYNNGNLRVPVANGCGDSCFIYVDPYNNADPGMVTLFALYDKILKIANAASLKVILLVRSESTEMDTTEVNLRQAFLAGAAAHFSNSNHNDALLAYDLFNEPVYQDTIPKTKQRVCEIISGWYDAIKANDPHHLITIGSCGKEDIFSYDPSILKVDFLSLHNYPHFKPYENRNDSIIQERAKIRTANGLYWFNQSAICPWIIGETGFSASGNPLPGSYGTLVDQRNYAAYSLDAVCNCGGSGYSWWEYQDPPYNNGADFWGLLERKHVPEPAAEKPAVNIFRNYTQNNFPPQSTGICPVNYSPTFDENKLYYNPYKHTAPDSLKIARYVVDQDGKPIKDAAIEVCTFFGRDTIAAGVKPVWRHDKYFTHTDTNGYFKAIPCFIRYGFVGHGADTTFQPYISHLRVSAAGTEEKVYRYSKPEPPIPILDTIKLNKIKDDVIVSGVTVLNGQTKTYTGRRSLTVSNTTINSGGNATFTSQKSIILLPGFVADAGSHVSIYIAPPDCNEMPLREEFTENMLAAQKHISSSPKSNQIELSFETDFLESHITLFPNPTTGELRVTSYGLQVTGIEVFDIYGRTMPTHYTLLATHYSLLTTL